MTILAFDAFRLNVPAQDLQNPDIFKAFIVAGILYEHHLYADLRSVL